MTVFNLNLGDSWKQVLRKAWSVRFAFVSACFMAAEMILPVYIHQVPPRLFAILAVLTSFGSILARITVQKGIK